MMDPNNMHHREMHHLKATEYRTNRKEKLREGRLFCNVCRVWASDTVVSIGYELEVNKRWWGTQHLRDVANSHSTDSLWKVTHNDPHCGVNSGMKMIGKRRWIQESWKKICAEVKDGMCQFWSNIAFLLIHFLAWEYLAFILIFHINVTTAFNSFLSNGGRYSASLTYHCCWFQNIYRPTSYYFVVDKDTDHQVMI